MNFIRLITRRIQYVLFFVLHTIPVTLDRAFSRCRRIVGNLFRWLFDFSETNISRVAHSRGLAPVRHLSGRGGIVHEFFQFVMRWCGSRPWFALVQAAPALIAGIVLPYFITQHGVASQTARTSSYSATVVQLMDSEEYEQAEVLLKELRKLAPENRRYQFLQAVVAERNSDGKRAARIMSRLAEQENYNPAHRWLARRHWNAYQRDPSNPELRSDVMLHSAALLTRNPLDADANRIMGSVLLKNGLAQRAIQHLRVVAGTDAVACIQIAELKQQSGDSEGAREYALRAREILNQESPADRDAQFYARLARTFVLLAEEEAGLRAIAATWQTSHDPQLRLVTSDLYFAWGNRLLNEKLRPEEFQRALGLFRKSLQANPQNIAVASKMAEISLQVDGPESSMLAEQLDNALAQGVEPSIVHFLHGTRALLSGDSQSAEFHLQQAIQHDAQTPGVLNNIAMASVIAFDRDPNASDSVNLRDALLFVDQALEMRPEHPYLHDTRGQVLFRLARIRESIPHFEKALQDERLRKSSGGMLVRAYRKLGQTELARRMEDSLLKLSADSDITVTKDRPDI